MLAVFRSTGTHVGETHPLLSQAMPDKKDYVDPATFYDKLRKDELTLADANKAAIERTNAFEERFGIKSQLKRNEDMRKTLSDPAARLKIIEDEIDYLSFKLGSLYAEKYHDFKTLGYGEVRALQMADDYIKGILDSELSILKAKYPYSFDAQGVVNELIDKAKPKLPGEKLLNL